MYLSPSYECAILFLYLFCILNKDDLVIIKHNLNNYSGSVLTESCPQRVVDSEMCFQRM